MCDINMIEIFFTSPALAHHKSASFVSLLAVLTEIEAIKEEKFHPINRLICTNGTHAQ
jgi:hypothetical protein